MRRFLGSFYGEVAAVYAALLLAAAVALGLLGAQALGRYAQEANQRSNRTLAAQLAPRFQASLGADVDPVPFEREARRIAEVRPNVGIYLLSEAGRVEGAYPRRPPPEPRVGLEPVRRFLAGGALPIFGDDPHAAARSEPFSAASFEAGGRPVILYVVLRDGGRGSLVDLLATSATAQLTFAGLALVLLGALALGLFAFALLGRRLRTVTEAVAAFERGDLDRRVGRRYGGEVGRLAEAFDRMAGTISGHVGELRRQAHLRRESLAALVHDLRTPLAVLAGYLERMREKGDRLGPGELQRYTAIGARQTRAASRLVDELFELSKLEVREVEPEPEAFPLAELVQDVAVQHGPRAEAADVRLEAERPERPERPVHAYADPVLVERALANLVENALRVTPSGGQVRLRTAEEEGRAQVRVSDTGPGIPADEVPRVFERFYQGQARRRNGSAGLGLAIAKRLVELQGGTLEVERTSEEGITFLVSLPLSSPEGGRTSRDVGARSDRL